MPEMNISKDGRVEYSLTCVNDTTTDWFFYIYQKMPNQPNDIYSLAWLVSPNKIPGGGEQFTFKWSIDYSFVWADTGEIGPGVKVVPSGSVPCDPATNNQTTFTYKNETPRLAPETPAPQPGFLTIHEGPNVPNLQFATGIGMSGHGTFVQQALKTTTQTYEPEPEYYVSVSTQIQMGIVLSFVPMSEQVEFPPGIYHKTITLKPGNSWETSK